MLPSHYSYIPLASVIYAVRPLYRHYGVYVGDGRVVHFAAKKEFETSAEDAFIQETTLADFAKDDEVFVEAESDGAFPPAEVVQNARSMVGKGKGEYSLVFNNCEHFANWCKYGRSESSQVKTAVAVTAAAVAVTVGLGLLAKAISDENK